MADRAPAPRRDQTIPHLTTVPCSGLCVHCLAHAVVEPLTSRRPGRVRRSFAAGSLALTALLSLAPASASPASPVAAAIRAATTTSSEPATTTTAAPPPAAVPAPVPAAEPPAPKEGAGYHLAAADGGVFTHGWYRNAGSAAGIASAPVIAIDQPADGEGYWLAGADGAVYAFGTAPFHGSAVDLRLPSPVVDMAALPDGSGYWLLTSDGGVFAFGGAGFFGSVAGLPHGTTVTAIAVTPSGRGYWVLARDGGVFAFGDAAFLGSAAGQAGATGLVELAVTPSGQGYWLVADDGGVFAFGDAPFAGSAAGQPRNGAVVDIEGAPSGRGYWVVTSDGGVFAFGDAPFVGSAARYRPAAPVLSVAGGIGRHAPGPEPPAPPPPPTPPPPPPIGSIPPERPAVLPASRPAQPSDDIGGQTGWDISWPQCGGPKPAAPFGFGIIGVTGGRAFRHNRCLAEQWEWARSSGAAGVYVNVNFPRTPDELARGATSHRQPNCNGAISCIAYNFGVNGVHDALAYAQSQGVDAPFIWLDVEVLNYWTKDRALNAVVIRGAIDAVRETGRDVGIYSTPLQWRRIAGDEAPGVPVWTAGAPTFGVAADRYCRERGFGGGSVAIVQLLPGQFDPNIACPGAGPLKRYFTTK